MAVESAMLPAMATGENRVQPGTLYLVGTPIGNLEDLTFRALRVLKEVDRIACEDTRQSSRLLSHYGVATRTVSYHEHNEAERAAELVADLQQGMSIALITDAGMPGISDPGYRLVTLAVLQGVPVIPIPGPAAFLTALVASGLPTDAFEFRGFLPSKSGARREVLSGIAASDRTQIFRTQIFYEAPHRIVESLADVVATLGELRPVVVARELTKMHEEFLRGTAAEVLAILRAREAASEAGVRGEITLLIGKAAEGAAVVQRKSLRERLAEIQAEDGVDEKTALKRLAKEMGVSKSEAYREWQREK